MTGDGDELTGDDAVPARMADDDRTDRIRAFLSEQVWPLIPAGQRGRRLTRAEEDEILGYGPDGV